MKIVNKLERLQQRYRTVIAYCSPASEQSGTGRWSGRPGLRIGAGFLLGSPLLVLCVLCAFGQQSPAVRQTTVSSVNRPAETTDRTRRPVTAADLQRAAGKFQLVSHDSQVVPCQALGPAAPHCIQGVDCAQGGCGERGWNAMRPIPWQSFAQGEYVGDARLRHVPQYRLRVDDQIEFVYRLTREETSTPYELNVGDEISVDSFTDEKLSRDLIIQPDGSITLRLLGQVRAANLTVSQLREKLEKLYKKYYKVPAITVTPLKVNTRLEDLRATVDSRAGVGGQRIIVRVTPEGTVQLPALGSVFVQGLTLDELRREVDARYAADIQGIAVTPILSARAPRFVYVVGEVSVPGRYVLEGPTTAMQAIALAQGWKIGANLRQIAVFRRGHDWRLKATLLDLQGALYSKRPCPTDEIWLNDSDIVVVPKGPILIANEFIEQVFTRGVYGVVPFQGISLNFAKASTL